MDKRLQQILVFQQNGSGLHKISGIEEFGGDFCQINIFNIDQALPPILDETDMYLPNTVRADLVLDFLKHPDLSYDLADLCLGQNIPVVASGQKEKNHGALTPPT